MQDFQVATAEGGCVGFRMSERVIFRTGTVVK